MNAGKAKRMDTPDKPLGPESALSRIEQAEGRVRRGRRWQAGTLAAVGAATLAYFALLGWSDNRSGLVGMVLTVLPALAVLAGVETWGRRSAPAGRETVRWQQRLAVVYALLACGAGVLAVLLPHPAPAALAGVLPALPCFVGARRAAGR